MAWVKLHDDILGDPKLMRAARTGGAELVLLPWLLAFASKAADDGRLTVGGVPADAEDIAYQIPGVDAHQVARSTDALALIGVLATAPDGALYFTKWERRQSKPSNAKEAVLDRVHRHRAKQSKGKRGVTNGRNTPSALQGVTDGQEDAASTPGNGTVTPCNATEEKRGEEKREENGGAVAPRRAARPSRESWVTEGVALWTARVGTIPIEQFGHALKPIVTLHGWPAVRLDLEKWIVARLAQAKPCNPTWYAKEASARLASKPPIVNEHGELTEYGERVSRPGAIPA